MSPEDPAWRGTIVCRTDDPSAAGWLVDALGPEAAREVPRARARVKLRGPMEVVVEIEAQDTGPARAALNTYLGWIHLTLATLDRARRGSAADSPRA